MARMLKRKHAAISNLGKHAQPSKQPRQAALNENNKGNKGTARNDSGLHISTTTVELLIKTVEASLEQAACLRTQMSTTFDEICQPAWAPETVSTPYHQPMQIETLTSVPEASLDLKPTVTPGTQSRLALCNDYDAHFKPLHLLLKLELHGWMSRTSCSPVGNLDAGI
ncbi:hypothetical protein BC835DRAFT_1422169 [Cytidiella melzeri]|nr:hypothetical protein BC835DRAFT_1422169 [Cytidiella melzeri]